MHFSNRLATANCSPLPPSKQCWDEQTLLVQGKVYRGAQTTTLLGDEGERGKIVLIVLRNLSSIFVYLPHPLPSYFAMCLNDCDTHEKSKTMVMQILGGTRGG